MRKGSYDWRAVSENPASQHNTSLCWFISISTSFEQNYSAQKTYGNELIRNVETFSETLCLELLYQ